MSRQCWLGVALFLVAGCSRPDHEIVARVGPRALTRGEVERRAAHGHERFCSALQDMIDEEVLVRVTCAAHPEIRGCGSRRDEILALATRETAQSAGAAEVEAVSNESEFLRRRAPSEPSLAVTLATLRKTRAAVRARAAPRRSNVRVRILAPCKGEDVDAPS